MTLKHPTDSGIKGLHHNAYRCRDSEETRKFYEDFLGLPLATTLELTSTKSARACHHLHTFYELDDGSYLAFFDAPDMPFEFAQRHDFDLHIALEVTYEHMLAMKAKGEALGLDVRGVSDHDFIHSIYFRDPNGYVIELTSRMPHHEEATDNTKNAARAKLDRWQRTKAQTPVDH
ncbi:MAG TPA: VOC family protein [Polyangiaceae bacterium]|jgi:catechol 2,3-dioxygenase-like lactoylglutathione lyase family enzyme|nr:VOC family protein [Polyangiaceae bacterium]